MNPTASFFIVAGFFSIIGGIIGYLIFRSRNRTDRIIKKMLKNPRRLVEELNKHGKLIDPGEDDLKNEIKITTRINPESGKEELSIIRIPIIPENIKEGHKRKRKPEGHRVVRKARRRILIAPRKARKRAKRA